jgi:competence protein ComEC
LAGPALLVRHPAVWLLAPTLFLLLGQALAPFFDGGMSSAAILFSVPSLFLLHGRTRRLGVVLLLGAVAVAVGFSRHKRLLEPVFPAGHLQSFVDRADSIYLEGRLLQEPEKLPDRSRWTIDAQRIWHPTGAEEVSGSLLLTVRIVRRDWRYGDRVRFHIELARPRDSGNPGGFNYARYLARRGIYVTAFLDGDQQIELVAREPGFLRGTVEDLRREIRGYIAGRFTGAAGPLLKALVIGDMGEISRETRGAFTAAGVSHVLSISGLHVAMLGLVIFVLIRFGGARSAYLSLRWNLVKVAASFSFAGVVFYTALAGAMVPTVRSAIMIGVYQLAVLLDREEEVFTSLALAALLIALVWPGVVADISFQLSFLAVLFIVWGARKAYFRAAPEPRGELPQERSRWRQIARRVLPHLLVPLLATVGTGPLIAHYFGHVSLAGFVANPLVVPLVGFVVVPAGLVLGFLAVAAPQAAAPVVWLTDRVLTLTLWLVERLAQLPLANIGVPAPNAWELLALYGVIVLLFSFKRNRVALAAAGLLALIICGDVYYWWRERWHRTELRVTHLNVGQGDAAVVEFPGSKVMLIDAGGRSFGSFDPGESIVAPFLRSRKILRVDYLVVSHARVDHYGGMRAIIEEFAPAEFWSGAPAAGERYAELERALSKAHVRRVRLRAGEPCRRIDAVKVCILHAAADDRDGSAVLGLEYLKARYLFAGDIERREEALLLREQNGWRGAVLKVPRHGNASASTPEFLRRVSPKLAIISGGAGGRYESQRREVAERYRAGGAEPLRTDRDGAISVRTEGKELRYETHKSGKRGTLVL